MPSDTIAITLDQRSPVLAVIDLSEPRLYQPMERKVFMLDTPLPDLLKSIYYEIPLRMSDNDIMTDGYTYSMDVGLYTSDDRIHWNRRTGRKVSGVVNTVERINEMLDMKRPSREVPISRNHRPGIADWSCQYFAVTVTSASEQKLSGPRILIEIADG